MKRSESLVERTKRVVKFWKLVRRLHLRHVHGSLFTGWLFAFTGQPCLPRFASLTAAHGQRLPQRSEIGLNIVERLHLGSETVRIDFLHAQHQFAQARADDFVAVLPQLVEQTASIGRVEFDVLSEVRHQIPSNDGQRMVRQLSQTVGPLVLVEVLDVAHRGAGGCQYAFIFGGQHVIEQWKGVPCQTTEQTGEDVGHGSTHERFFAFVEAQGELVTNPGPLQWLSQGRA